MYIPGFSNMLMQRMARGGSTSRFADADGFMYDPEMIFQPEDMGGPAYVDFAPYAEPMPAYAAPQDDFLARIRQAEAMAQAEAPVYTPDMGALDMMMRPDLFGGGPAYADMMPAAMPEQVSMLPFAPEAPAPQPMMQPPMTQPSGLGGRQNFMDERDIFIGDAPDRFSQSMNMENYVEPQRDPVTGLLLNAQGQPGFQFMTDRGRQAGFGSGNTGFLTADPNAQYRMFDERGKNRIVAEGTGLEALQNIYNTANQFNQEQGKKANWGIERLNPTTGQWERVAENDPAKGTGIVGDIIGAALPLAALAIPGFGQMGLLAQAAIGAGLGGAGAGIAGNDVLKGAVMGGLTAAGGHLGGELLGPGKLGLNLVGTKAGTAIGSGLGATAGGLATGQPLDNALIGGALAGAGTFAGQQAAGALRDMGVNLPAFNAPTPSTPGNIVVTGPANVPIPISTGMGGGSGKPKPPTPEPMSGGIDDTGILVRAGGALPMLGAGLPIALPQGTPTTPEELAQRRAEQERENEIIVEAQRGSLPSGFDPGPLSTALPNLISTPVSTPDLSPEIVVEGERAPFDDTAVGLPFVPPAAPVQTPDFGGEIIVTDTKLADDTTGALPFVPPTTPLQTPDVAGDPITVETERKPAQVTTAALPFYAGLPITIPAGVPTTPEELARKQAEDRENEIVVTGNRITNMAGGAPSFGTVPVTPSLPSNRPPAMPEATPNEIVVTNKPTVPNIPIMAPLPYTPMVTPPVDTGITVTGERPKPFDMSAPLPPLSAVPTTAGGEFGNKQVVAEEKKGVLDQLKDRLGNLDAADYLRLAGVLLPLLDGVGGGGRRGALSTIPSGMFGRSSVFGGSLPRATLPGASTGFAPRAPSTLGPQTTQDYYRYGYGPAQSFFDYVPQGAANTSQAFTGYNGGGMAGDGDMPGMSDNSFAVNGPGTGRSDEIPAMLSDGEYVIDAETVALLGDGSSKAGANLLDQFRINVRKDKGRDLVKGDFSANAKRPEHYLKGGRT